MRIACLYLPSFPLQVSASGAPERAAPRAVAERGTIALCSRAAWEAGVRPGMTVAQARQLAPGCEIGPGDPGACRRARDALAAALGPVATAVEPGPLEAHQCVYAGVPRGHRGDGFGATLLEIAGRHGFRARVGVADDRFTAWAAAAVAPRSAPTLFAPATTVVPRGGAAAFLAPLPLDLLPLSEDVRQMLVTLGVRTLGDFADLPPPSTGRWSAGAVDYQKLARGEGPSALRPLPPPEALAAEPAPAAELPNQRSCYHPRGPWRRCIDRERRSQPARCSPSSRRRQRRGCWSASLTTSSGHSPIS